jgi:raffinose/stachyose/melibiose transport system permease protein
MALSARRFPFAATGIHIVLLIYTVISLAPALVVLINSFKTRKAIFGAPLALPDSDSFSLVGYRTAFSRGNFALYFENSVIVTVCSLLLIVVFGAMAAFALSEYKFRGNTALGVYLVLGVMVPIRLGTVGILKIMVAAGLANTLTALILVYTAQGLPLAVFVMSEFMKQVSDDLKNAARVDGLSEYRILFRLVMPVMRPAIATIAVFTMVPIWNDLWFPLVLAFMGQFITDWNAVLAALSLAILPMLALYLIFSRQMIRGITAGAVK